MPSSKLCSVCQIEKPLANFTKGKSYKDGYRGQCTQCRSQQNKQNPNYEMWLENEKRRSRVRTKSYVPVKFERRRATKLKSKYGLTLDKYYELYIDQGGCCAICRTATPKGRHNTFHVDHDHTTGRVRGLLCHLCNYRLGIFRDDIALLEATIKYLST